MSTPPNESILPVDAEISRSSAPPHDQLHVPGGMFRMNLSDNNNISIASPEAASIFACDSVDEFLSLKPEILFADPAVYREIFEAVLERNELYEGSCELIRKNGERFRATLYVSSIDTTCGNACCLLFTVIEMTTPNRLMTALKLQKAVAHELSRATSLQAALDALIDISLQIEGVDSGGVYVVDNQKNEIHLEAYKNLSDAFIKKIAILSIDSAIMTPFRTLKPLFLDKQDFAPPTIEMYEEEGLLSTASIPIVYNGKITGFFNLASRSVTSFPLDTRYIIEAIGNELGVVFARLQAENDILLSRERYRYLIENISDVIYRVDAETEDFVFLSPNIEELSGYSLDNIDDMGGRVAFLYKVLCSPYKGLKRIFKDMELSDVQEKVSTIEYWWFAKDGSKRCIQDSWRPLFYEDTFIGTGGTLRDITEFKRMEKELQRSHKLESLGVLAGGIAHDFNNILTAIMGNISLVMMESGIKEDSLELLREAEKACNQSKNLTAQLLTFSKGGSPVKALHSLPDIIKDSTAFYLRGSQVKCSYFFDSKLWTADIDEGQIGQVLQNLVINAEQAMPVGGKIEISAENKTFKKNEMPELSAGRYVSIKVADSGTGISPEDIDRIYDPYYTTKDNGQGLGLSITYSIVRRHSGTIVVDSTAGKGSTFTVYLPASGEPARDRVIPECSSDNPPLRVLIMDDEPSVRTILSRILCKMGNEVAEAEDGESAIKKYELARNADTPFDVVIMDLTIPGGMGGKEAVTKILAINPMAQVLVSSGYSNDPVIADYRDYGFSGIISKPFRIDDLKNTLDAIHR